MKIYKKHILISLFLLIGLFVFATDRVDASINWNGVTVECIYSDGSLYEYSYNEYEGGWVTNRSIYNLKGTDSTQSISSSYVVYSSYDDAGRPTYESGADGSPHCQSYVSSSVVQVEDDDGNKTTYTYSKFFNNDYDEHDFTSDDIGGTSNWVSNFWESLATTITLGVINENIETYNLVSENYILTDDAGEPENIYRYKREDEHEEGEVTQAVSIGTYLTIYDYGDVYLIQSSSKTNSLSQDFIWGDVVYFSDADAKSYSGNSSSISYYFESVKITWNGASGDGYYRYVYEGETTEEEEVDTGELCTTIMPKTSQYLALVISWMQILVPVLLILLIALDIGKIVISGNLDEELPKQKKKIITRIIVAIAFFFLPLIMNIMLSMVKVDSGTDSEEVSAIQYIKCIFEQTGIYSLDDIEDD